MPDDNQVGSIQSRTPSMLERAWDTVRNSALGYGGLARVPGMGATQTVNDPEYQQNRGRLISAQRLFGESRREDVNKDPSFSGVLREGARSVTNSLSDLTTPTNTLMLLAGPAMGGRLVTTVMGAQMLEAGARDVEETGHAIKEGRWGDAATHAGNAVVTVGMGRQMIRHMDAQVNPRGAPVQDSVTDANKAEQLTFQQQLDEARTLNAALGQGHLQRAYESSRKAEDIRTAARQAGAAPTGFERETTKSSQVPPRTQVGARPGQESSARTEESIQAPGSSARPGEPVLATPRPEVTGTEPRSLRGVEDLSGLQKLEGSLRVTDPSAMETINRDLERRGIIPPGPDMGRRAGDIKKSEGERGSLSFRPLNAQQKAQFQSPFRSLADVIDQVLPDKPEIEQAARTIIRDSAARLALKTLRAEEKMKDLITSHDNDGKTEFQAFMDAGEGKPGAQFLSPQDQAAADFFHTQFEDRWAKVQKIREMTGAGIDHYLSHLWEKRGTALDTLSHVLYAKRPLEGRAGFLKGRVYDYASEGLASGLKPITYNPIRMQLATLFQLDKFIMAHDIKDMYVGQGLAKWFKFGDDMQNKPSTWQSFDDKIFRPSKFEEGGLKSYGTYFGPPEVAKVFNRYLSPGLRGNFAYDSVRAAGNVLNQAQLTASAYHATFEAIVASASDVGLGLQKISRGDLKGGASDILTAAVPFRSAGIYYGLGKRIQAEALEPTGNPGLARYVKAITEAGGRFKQENTTYTAAKTGSLMSAIKRGKIFEAASTGLQNIPILKNIMQKWVPNIKLGMAARMIDAKLDWLQKDGISDPMTIANEMGKIWDSVDNRAGQLVYDNLFWNKVAKDTAFLAVRSVGWNYGTFREGLGALKDTAKQGARVLRGQRPEITDRMAFTAGLTITAGLIGSAMHYIGTGKIPRNATDMYFPSTGVVGSSGKDERLSIPAYHKDVVALYQHPGDTIIHKVHPLISMTAAFWQNADFYGTEIYNPADSLMMKAGKSALFAGKQLEPLGVSALTHQLDRGVPPVKAALSLVGIMPAPTYIGQTKAEELAFDLEKRKWQAGPRTSGDEDRRNAFMQLRQKLDAKTLTGDDLSKAMKEGKIVPNDINRLFKEQGLTTFQQNFKGLKLHEAMPVMRVATPEERAQLRPLMVQKLNQLNTYPPQVQQDLIKQFKAVLE